MERMATRRAFLTGAASLAALLAGCAAQEEEAPVEEAAAEEAVEETPAVEDPQTAEVRDTVENHEDGGHAIEADGETAEYAAIDVIKTGEADGDEADFYGENSAIFATNGAALTLDDITVTTDGTHANAVFSYGEGTQLAISNSLIETSSNCSGGIMVTGGGTLTATDLEVHTQGNSSAAIRSDRGGGIQDVHGGIFTTAGTGSPAIYSTADVTVTGASLASSASQGVVVEGKNSVKLVDCELDASNTTKNSDKSDWYQAVMIYQSMSGDAAEGEASFSMEGGTLTNRNGDLFFVNNTVATIALTGAKLVNEDAEGAVLRAAAAGWGSEGSNGGHVTLTATDQELAGDLLVDSVSSLNLYLGGSSVLNGAVNPANEGEVYVELTEDATWILSADSYIDSLTCDAAAIDLNGHTLTVGGTAYTAGTESTGEAIVVEVSASAGGGPGGTPPDGGQGGPGGTPPDGGQGGEPPAKP